VPNTCSIEGCENIAKSRGWCNTHYERWRRNGDVRATKLVKVCRVTGCGRRSIGRGYCEEHHEGYVGARKSWEAMWRRCTNPADPSYASYVGRGITIDPKWRSFDAFLSEMGARPTDTSIDRIDNNGPYTSSNCRWATIAQQQRNTRKTRITMDIARDVRRCATEGIPQSQIAVKHGLSIQHVSKIVTGKIWQEGVV
jgi:hypothetical protein